MVTVKDLEERPPHGVMLFCPVCQAEFSAWCGDYFWMDRDEAFTCGADHEEVDLLLVRKRTVFEEIES